MTESLESAMPPFATALAVRNQTSCELIKNRYLDYGIIRNATCHFTWAFIEVFESFIRRELKKTPYINVMA